MKTYLSATMTALAVGTIGLLSPAQAGPLNPLARLRHPAENREFLKEGDPHTSKYRSPMATPAAPAGYPHYQMIDLGTLGGPSSLTVFPARALNNRGEMIASSLTADLDPNCYFDCNDQHAILRQPNANIVELPIPAGFNSPAILSLSGDLTANGLIAGFATNGLLDPSTDFPETRAVIWDRNGANPTDLGTLGEMPRKQPHAISAATPSAWRSMPSRRIPTSRSS